jgi:hypothetical protein
MHTRRGVALPGRENALIDGAGLAVGLGAQRVLMVVAVREVGRLQMDDHRIAGEGVFAAYAEVFPEVVHPVGPVGCAVDHAPVAQYERAGGLLQGHALQRVLDVEDGPLRCPSGRWGSRLGGKPPPKMMLADSGSTVTRPRSSRRSTSSTAVLPAPGPPVSTMRRGGGWWEGGGGGLDRGGAMGRGVGSYPKDPGGPQRHSARGGDGDQRGRYCVQAPA